MTKRRGTAAAVHSHRSLPLSSSSPRLVALAAVRRPARPVETNLHQSIRHHMDNLQVLALLRPRTVRWVFWLTDYLARKQLLHDVAAQSSTSLATCCCLALAQLL